MSSPTPLARGDHFASALETCRRFLLCVANDRMPRYLVPKGEASDLVQETLVSGFRNRHQFHGRTLSDLRAWLRGILLNELASFRRRYRASCRDVAREIPVGSLGPGCAGSVAVCGALDEMIRAERVEAVTAAVARLPGDVRAVVVLRVHEKLSFRAIGARLGRSEDAVRKSFTRALDRLRGAARNAA
jgi:RNA polymerase sigma-70 factor (subfamily 1)